MPLCPGMCLPLIIAAGAAALTPPAIAQTATDALGEAKLYDARCTACHSLDTNRIGPAHRGVFGRPAGSAPGYACSTTIKASGIVWNAGTLDTWLQGPQKMVPGARMYYVVPNPAECTAIIACLRRRRANYDRIW